MFGRLLISITLAIFVCRAAASAEIELFNLAGELDIVSIKGEIVDGDGDRFNEVVRDRERVSVVLQSPGGLVRDALQIGAEIRLRNFATMVSSDGECYSACGLIWISGARRYMSAGSKIGFHAAYREENGEYRESGVANAEIGSFLTHLGLRIEAIRYFTIAGPQEFLLLTPEHARALGIDVFEQNGIDVVSPDQLPTVDTYADRFVSYTLLRSRCTGFFQPAESAIDEGIRQAFDEGNRLVGAEQWIKLWTPMLDRVKLEIISKGALLLCLDTQSHLRRQGQPTGINSPSFNCSQASTLTEHAICSDENLWAKDRAVNAIYFWIRSNVESSLRQRILAVQRKWLGERNACGGDFRCLNEVYDARIDDVKLIDVN
ncbi:MAG: hypothetical protein KF914_14810 [Rhizobiaceae bacterium]|nr:hypothetical protein [Rhizobiaceae bacterium]